MASEDSFTTVSSDPRWYEGLKLRTGSCLDLYDLLETNRGLIHELGPNRKTVLHKGVHHGCVKLVKFVLVDMFDEGGYCKCKGGDDDHCGLTREELLRKTDKRGDTAVNMVLVSGSPKMVKLLAWAIEVSKCDRSKKLPSDREESDDEGRSPETPSTISSGNVPEVDDEVFIENEWAPIIYESEYKDKYGSDFMNRGMYDKVYDIIEEAMGECGEWINVVKEKIKGDVDYQFVPIKQIIVHYLFTHPEISTVGEEIMFLQRIVGKCISKEGCEERRENKDDRMIVTLFNIFDPQGRTLLHASHQLTLVSKAMVEHKILNMLDTIIMKDENKIRNILDTMPMKDGSPLPEATIRRCMIAKDGKGRIFWHNLESHHDGDNVTLRFAWKIFINPRIEGGNWLFVKNILVRQWYRNSGVHTLHCWCFGNNPCVEVNAWGDEYCSITPLHMAIIFDNRIMFRHIVDHVHLMRERVFCVSPFQLASILGRTWMVEWFLKYYTKSKNIRDHGFGNDYNLRNLSAIHYAAVTGRSETVQMILRYPIYDPICQYLYGTALHTLVGMDMRSTEHDGTWKNAYDQLRMIKELALGMDMRSTEHDGTWKNAYDQLRMIKELALHNAFPSSPAFKRIQKDFHLLDVVGNVPRMYTDDEKTCINLLIQGGIDVWTTIHSHGEFPSVTEDGNNEARAWWGEKVVKEVEIKKASITTAANAIAVVGALVATTSFIGPLQPPSSYGVEGDYIHMSRKAIQVYLVCNNFSFFFSIASILMAVLPAIPMSKESLYDEMLRSERCLKTSVAFLLISIIGIIGSFSSASIAVVSPQWHERKFAIISIALGGVLCLFVLVIHIIRLLRMVFHKNNWLRRRFARHMYF